MAMDSRQVGQLLRQLRRQRGLTGEELGVKVSLSQSKISKIETGYYSSLNTIEIEHILNILDAPKIIRQQVAVALGRMNAQGPQANFYSILYKIRQPEYWRQIKQFRIFGINIIPVHLQLVPYRQSWAAKTTRRCTKSVPELATLPVHVIG